MLLGCIVLLGVLIWVIRFVCETIVDNREDTIIDKELAHSSLSKIKEKLAKIEVPKAQVDSLCQWLRFRLPNLSGRIGRLGKRDYYVKYVLPYVNSNKNKTNSTKRY